MFEQVNFSRNTWILMLLLGIRSFWSLRFILVFDASFFQLSMLGTTIFVWAVFLLPPIISLFLILSKHNFGYSLSFISTIIDAIIALLYFSVLFEIKQEYLFRASTTLLLIVAYVISVLYFSYRERERVKFEMWVD